MSDIQEHHLRCEIEFCTLLQGDAIAGPFRSEVHLFEHQYDPATHFWYGVAAIECSPEVFRNAVTEAGDWDRLELAITLPDGRFGAARVTNWKALAGDQRVRIALTGWSKLQ